MGFCTSTGLLPPGVSTVTDQDWEGLCLAQTRLKAARGHIFLHPAARFLNPSGETRPQECFQQGLYDQVQTPTLLPRGSRNEHHVVPGREHRPRPCESCPGHRKRLRWAAESRGCAPLDHGDPGEAPAGGRACGQRGPGPGGQLPELVPAGRTGAESKGGGEPAGHGGRLRHGGPGERAARGAAVRGATGRTPVAAHLLNQRPAGARARRAAEPVGMGAAAAGAAARAAGPGLALEPLLCAVARAGPLGAPHVLARGGAPAIAAGHWRTRGCGEGFGQHPQRVLFHRAALHGSPPRSFQPHGSLSGTLPPARGSCDGLQEPLEEEDDEKEPNSPLMVPAADVLNHLANHNANLEYSPNCLRMVATQPIPKGHEIFNTYGQMANWQLIHMYGFTEPYPDNTDDTADIQMVTVREAALQGTKVEAERLLLYERWDFLCKLEMVGEEGAFVIGREEVLTEEELAMTLKVLCMPAEEFREFKDQDGWGDDKREEDSLTITNIPKLKASWRQLLRDSVLLTLQTYATDLKTEQDLLSSKEVYATLSWREQQALQECPREELSAKLVHVDA
ncbi:N-lysine methyltransferase SETD6 isoform X2 [Delphinapterus leucas]|uniref:N-lysine methyltransferase SETD6 n=1 Tax=Delphinapterus leucas TaxID=9749 RepID=A0A7F8KD04_DELLE|nr:N-lysine methyltransferase SETD6 isoform X2 [Delphinapterus leucas]